MDVDNMVLHFDENQLQILNYCLGFMMFGVALDLTLDDFKRVLSNPRSTLIGMTSQLVLLPLFTFFLVLVWDMPTSMKMGFFMGEAVPGVNISINRVHGFGGKMEWRIRLTSIFKLFHT